MKNSGKGTREVKGFIPLLTNLLIPYMAFFTSSTDFRISSFDVVDIAKLVFSKFAEFAEFS
ncbi:unnamed protein product [Arabis nemorensis]|uniref:Uncharacterized protein n=1 Tax=Arabis nemorensis TaxID=586526 RepID=A0A565BU20_9BRAS|nr:unnamed protein product [Arabis nemorensis]